MHNNFKKTVSCSNLTTAIFKEKRSVKRINFRNLCLLGLFVIIFSLVNTSSVNAQMTVVQKYGQLRVSGNKIVDKNGNPVQLRGMSLYWSQWIGKYYTFNTIKWLRDDWKITVIRAALGINGNTDGYLVNPTAEKNKIIAVVDAAIQLGIYVVIDWHDHNAHNSRAQAQAFFSDMATRYGNVPNVLYETWNEPLNYSWSGIIKPYHQAVIASIRAHDPDNIIICGTRNWSQEVDEAAADPISGGNIAYTLHFYATTHGAGLRAKASTALSRGAALFVTEYGTTEASGGGVVSPTSTRQWYDFLDQNSISDCNWSVADIGESSAALTSGASPNGGWSLSQIKQSGQIVRSECIAKAPDLSGNPPPPPPPPGNVANGTYRITARSSGKSLDVTGASTADGANVIQWTYGGGTNQQWSVVSLSTGVYAIRAVHSGKSLDVSGFSTADGGDINQWTYSGSNNQRWRIESVGSGFFRIVSVNSGKAVEITGNSLADGAAIDQRTYSGATNQQFTFQLLSNATIARSAPAITAQEVQDKGISQVYPNPSSGAFVIDAKGSFTYFITDINGKVVEKGNAVNKASVGNKLSRGAYIIQVKTLKETKEIKLIKN